MPLARQHPRPLIRLKNSRERPYMESGLFRVLDRTSSYGRITTPARIGPATNATMKDVPIVMPTVAIA